jgi:hypothetical protein
VGWKEYRILIPSILANLSAYAAIAWQFHTVWVDPSNAAGTHTLWNWVCRSCPLQVHFTDGILLYLTRNFLALHCIEIISLLLSSVWNHDLQKREMTSVGEKLDCTFGSEKPHMDVPWWTKTQEIARFHLFPLYRHRCYDDLDRLHVSLHTLILAFQWFCPYCLFESKGFWKQYVGTSPLSLWIHFKIIVGEGVTNIPCPFFLYFKI